MGRAEYRAKKKRTEKEEKEFKKNAKKVWSQLTDEEKQLLTELKEQEISERLDQIVGITVMRTLDKLKDSAIKTLKEHRISDERVQSIISEFLLYVDKDQGYHIENISLKDDYMIIERVKYHENIKDLVCETLHHRCKGCTENKKNCSLFAIYKKIDIPTSSWNRKNCKYSYE